MFPIPSNSSGDPTGIPGQIPIGVKIIIGVFLSPFVAVGIGLILLVFGVFREFVGDPPLAFMIPFTIIWNGIIVLMIYLFFIKKMNFQGQIERLQRRMTVSGPPSPSSQESHDSYPPNKGSNYESGYTSESRQEFPSPAPPRVPRSNMIIGGLLGFLMPLSIILYLVIFQIYPMFEEAGGSIEQAYTTNGIMLILMVLVVLSLLISMFRSTRRMQRMSENASSF